MDDIDIAQQRQTEEIQRALDGMPKMTGDSLTHCDECEDPIPIGRRQAVPGCTLCITCQRDLEQRR